MTMPPSLTLAVSLLALSLTSGQVIQKGIGNSPLWHLDALAQCPIVPDLDGSGVTVYLVDTGCMEDHNELKAANITNYALTGFNASLGDTLGSGTHMASMLVGKKVGFAKGVKLVCVRVYGDDGKSTEKELLDGVAKTMELHANDDSGNPAIMLMTSVPTEQRETVNYGCFDETLGQLVMPRLVCVDPWRPYNQIWPYCEPDLTGCRNFLDRAMENAFKQGIIPITSAGNNGADACDFSPARIEFGLTFGAIDSDNAKWSGSNAGACVDAYAPGVKVTGAWNTHKNDYRSEREKTSTAAALGAAVVARILQAEPELKVDDIRAKIVASSRPAGGINLLNVPCAQTPSPSPSPSPTPVVGDDASDQDDSSADDEDNSDFDGGEDDDNDDPDVPPEPKCYDNPFGSVSHLNINLLALGDVHVDEFKIHGRMMAAGDMEANRSNFEVKGKNKRCIKKDALRVAHDLTIRDSVLIRSSAVCAGELENIDSEATEPGEIIQGSFDFDFGKLAQDTAHFVDLYASLTPNGEIVGDKLVGKNELLNVFMLSSIDELAKLELDIPKKSSAVINIGGATPRLEEFKFRTVNGCGKGKHGLLNFYEATEVTLFKTRLFASVVTKGKMEMRRSQVRGQVICGSFEAIKSNVFMSKFIGRIFKESCELVV
mmetsp:Transcript_10155/g.25455  ORF Transcript_10155/g.25455 Transcript_10155/m.25455 type:complete len:658 (-) Transcript_10155:64-2037(-)